MNIANTRRWSRFRNRVLPWLGLLIAIGLIGLAVSFTWPQTPKLQTLSITAGSQVGTRARIQELLTSSTQKRDELRLTGVGTTGSGEALRKVDQGEIDLALVQGGLGSSPFPNVRRVATLNVEPLHLLVRDEIYGEISIHPRKLEKKTINLSKNSSGTHELATDLLAFLSVKDFNETNYGYEDFLEGKIEQLPDAVFTVSSLPSPVAEYLITQHHYRLVQLPFADSFHLHWFENHGAVNRFRITDTRIPAYTYQVDPGRPAKPVETFGTRLELVAKSSLSDVAVDALCRSVYESEFSRITGEAIKPDFLREESTFALHPAALEYLNRLQPVSTGRMIEVTEQLVGIFGAALGGMLFFWQWMKRTRERRRDQEFVSCVKRVVEIETIALSYDQDDSISVADLEMMQNELGDIKRDLLRRYQAGELEGAEMLSAFLKHANDASELISRIVLHETEPKASVST